MSLNYSVAPGAILKEYITSYGFNQKEFAKLINSSAKHLSNIINGKARITEEFAVKLEEIFKEVKAEFWMNLEVSYRLYVIRTEKHVETNIIEIARRFQFKHVFSGLKMTLQQQSTEMLKILGLQNFDDANKLKNSLTYDFMEDGGEDESILVWLKLCENEIDLQNDLSKLNKFDSTKLVESLEKYKLLLNSQNFSSTITNLRKFSNRLGISLVLYDALPNSKIRGATAIVDGNPAIFLSTRFKKLDSIYFAFVHELSHIISNTELNLDYMVSNEKITEEKNQNEFTREFFITNDVYKEFLENNHPITEVNILKFAKKTKVIPDIVVGFLQHDKHIKYDHFNSLRQKISWR